MMAGSPSIETPKPPKEGWNTAQSKNEPGMKYDADKVPIHLFPGDALFAICRVLDFGARKYSDRNWEKGMSWSRCFSACMRHMWQWWQGAVPTKTNFLFGDLDEETKFSHLWHAGCCIVFLIAFEERDMYVYDDRPVKASASRTSRKDPEDGFEGASGGNT